MLLALTTGFAGDAAAAPATSNLVAIQHGTTKTAPLTVTGGTAIVPGPVTGDVDAAGTVTDSLVVRVGGVRFDEVAEPLRPRALRAGLHHPDRRRRHAWSSPSATASTARCRAATSPRGGGSAAA